MSKATKRGTRQDKKVAPQGAKGEKTLLKVRD